MEEARRGVGRGRLLRRPGPAPPGPPHTRRPNPARLFPLGQPPRPPVDHDQLRRPPLRRPGRPPRSLGLHQDPHRPAAAWISCPGTLRGTSGHPPGPAQYVRAMIERYTLPEMGRVWSEAHKYELWCRVEVLVLAAHARAGTVPADSVEPVRSALPPTPAAAAAVEAGSDHDVIAFLSAWAHNTTPRSAAAYVHYGMTSSDLLDTALALQLTYATDILW